MFYAKLERGSSWDYRRCNIGARLSLAAGAAYENVSRMRDRLDRRRAKLWDDCSSVTVLATHDDSWQKLVSKKTYRWSNIV